MAYEALYTSERPKNLAQLIGQDHISNALTRALNQDRMSHAYLLVGTRGTGKTSTARILAKAVNCNVVHDSMTDKNSLRADSIPCNKCDACINFKSSPDNIEFDAASNRSVEDVSRLLSTAYLAPLQSRFKTFIIDEVHMLSFEAVNSILKLIEEPPKNVIFFLATTEFNKVPMTIRSRCQILNFKLIPAETITEHLIKIAAKLNLKVERYAAEKIARLAKGSMRDALTFFDQCYSMCDTGKLTLEMVDDTLGLVSDADLDEIIDAAESKNRKEIINSTAKVFKSGLTANNIAESLITRLRDKVAVIFDANSQKLTIYNELIDRLRQSIIEMQNSGIPEVIFETTLFKFASNPILNDEEEKVIKPKNKVINIKEFQNNEQSNVKSNNNEEYEWKIEITEEEQPEIAKYLLEKLITYCKEIAENAMAVCLNYATASNYFKDVITINFSSHHYGYFFKEHVSKLENILKEKTGRDIKFNINGENNISPNDSFSINRSNINELPEDEKQYLINIIKIFNVSYENVHLIIEDE